MSTPLWSALILLRDTVRVSRRASCALASAATLNGTYSTSSFTLPITCARGVQVLEFWVFTGAYSTSSFTLLTTCARARSGWQGVNFSAREVGMAALSSSQHGTALQGVWVHTRIALSHRSASSGPGTSMHGSASRDGLHLGPLTVHPWHAATEGPDNLQTSLNPKP